MKLSKILLIVDVFFLSFIFYKALSYPIFDTKSCQHFVSLAQAFLNGTLSLQNPGTCPYDVIIKNGNIFLPFGPLPAILLMPFVAVSGLQINQVLLSHLATLVIPIFIWRICNKLEIKSIRQKLWYIVLFIFGSLYFIYWHWEGPWPVGHAVALLFLIVAIDTGLTKGNEVLTGLLVGLSFLTRTPTIFAFIFFLVFWFNKSHKQLYLQRIGWLMLGMSGPILFFFWYNYVRFGNIIESGYSLATVGAPVLEAARKVGLFSFAHIPKNLFTMLGLGLNPVPDINSPTFSAPYITSNPWGMSIFLSTPALVYIFAAKIKNKMVIASWAAALFIAIPIVLYYGIGYAQFGYRYSLDFFPFLFLLIILATKDNFTLWPRALILLGVLINTYWR